MKKAYIFLADGFEEVEGLIDKHTNSTFIDTVKK